MSRQPCEVVVRIAVIFIGLVILFAPFSAQAQLGLKERQVVDTFMSDFFPGIQEAVNQAAGFEVELVIDWDSVAQKNTSDKSPVLWKQVFFDPIPLALKQVNIDELAQNALEKKLQTIRIVSTGENSLSLSGYEPGLADGELLIDDKIVNVRDVRGRAERLADFLARRIGALPSQSSAKSVFNSIHNLEYKNVGHVLFALEKLKDQLAEEESDHTVQVMVNLLSGNAIRGQIIDFNWQQTNEQGLLLFDGQKYVFSYIPLKSIQSVSVYSWGLRREENVAATGELVRRLSFGALKYSPAKIPARLSVMREMRDLEQEWQQTISPAITISADWDALPETDKTAVGMHTLLNDLKSAVMEITQHSEGMAAFKAKIHSIRINAAKTPGIHIGDQKMDIQVAVQPEALEHVSKRQLLEHINQNL